jgi:hypothetical protein
MKNASLNLTGRGGFYLGLSPDKKKPPARLAVKDGYRSLPDQRMHAGAAHTAGPRAGGCGSLRINIRTEQVNFNCMSLLPMVDYALF